MKADEKQIVRLLKTARGQIDGILKMVEEDQYCLNISAQLLAAQAMLRKTNKEILRAHMRSCVKNALSSSDEADAQKKIEELCCMIDKLSSS